MAYTDDAVKAKLSALNETQESIVTVAQWIMFHRRHADRTASLLLQRLKDSGANKRLNLIYLANEVAQQSKARQKTDFIDAFEPVIAEATSTAYRGATNEVQQKIRRVVEVWRQRQIFETSIQEAVEGRIDGEYQELSLRLTFTDKFAPELDKSRSAGKKPLLGGSLFSSGSAAPSELQPLVSLQVAVAKATATTITATQSANHEYEKLTDPSKTTPSPPVHAARLSALLKSLASAEGAVNESIKARSALLEGLETLLESNKRLLEKERGQYFELTTRKNTIDAKKRDVEDGIMRGLSAEDGTAGVGQGLTGPTPNGRGHDSVSAELERPQHEELTPPPVESLTPTASPHPASSGIAVPQDAAYNKQPDADLRGSAIAPPLFSPRAGALNGISHEPSTNLPNLPLAGSPGSISGGPSKKRKLEDDFGGFGGGDAMADLDDDVADLLRAESGDVHIIDRTSLFFLPTVSADSSPLPQFLNTLGKKYNSSPLQPWTLQHRLFRDTSKPAATSVGSSIDEQPRATGPRYLQILTLSHHPSTSYVAISSTIAPAQTRAGTPASSTISGESSGEPATIISIPSASQSDEFVQLLATKFGPLWTQRQTLSVRNGQTFEVGDYTVRAGEVVQGYGAGSGAAALARGVVVEIEWSEEDGNGDDGGEGLVQAFWDTLGVKGARECVNVAGMPEGFSSVRQWIEALRIRN